jgi:DNA-binding transcriptional MerR regulator
LNIQAFSKKTNISSYTIRYYEKIGLLKNIGRNSSGHRWFTEKDVLWLSFIKRLKNTGMPLENIRLYAELRELGDTTSKARMMILQKHALLLEEKISEEQCHLKKLKEKIEYYNELL